MQPILVSPQEIRGIVTMNEAVEAVRLGFREWGESAQLNAPRRRIHLPTGVRVSVHQGGVPAAKATGLMTHCEWVKPMASEQVYPRLNHPVIVLYDATPAHAGHRWCISIIEPSDPNGPLITKVIAVKEDAFVRAMEGRIR